MLEDNPFFTDADQGRRRRLGGTGEGRRDQRSAAARLGRRLRHPPGAAVLVLRRLPVPRAGRGRRRLPRAVPRPHGRVPRVDQRSSVRCSTGCPKGPISSRPGVKSLAQVKVPKGRGLRARRGTARRSRLLSGGRRLEQALPDEVARRVVLESVDPAAHPARLQASPTSSRSWGRWTRCSGRWTDERARPWADSPRSLAAAITSAVRARRADRHPGVRHAARAEVRRADAVPDRPLPGRARTACCSRLPTA